ncbi:MAG: helix-turn-helix domain-containing protein, partial [Gaiellales bacterium]
MRFSFESRCRIVEMIARGASPQAAAAACGASRATGYRLWRRYREGGFAALADRPSTPRVPAAPPVCRGRAGDPALAYRARRRPGGDRHDRRASLFDRGQGAEKSGLLAASACPPRSA